MVSSEEMRIDPTPGNHRHAQQRLSRRQLGRIAVASAGLAWMSGCGRSTPTGTDTASRSTTPEKEHIATRVSQSAGGRSVTPGESLQRLIARYRSAKSYCDRAVVRMTYRVADREEHDTVPLSVHYIAPDQLTLEAYSTQLMWRGGTLRAFVESPQVNRLDRQLLLRSFKRPQIEVAKLYQDPLLRHFATAGPAGPAPQIELLFGETPLAGFFADGVRLDFVDDAEMNGQPCRRLTIEAEGSKYVLWIDRHDAILRRVELPSISLPHMGHNISASGAAQQQTGAKELTLSIELIDAVIDGPSVPFADRLPRSELVTVDTLTVPPPPLASALLGRQAAPFRLTCLTNHSGDESAFEVTERGSDREHTILLWVANHSGSRLAIEEFAAFADRLPSEVRRTSRFVVVQAETLRADAVRRAKQHPSIGWTTDEEAIGRDRFMIEQAPALCVLGETGTVHWLQSPVGPEMTATLDGLLRDRLAGIDVGTMLREQYQTDLDTYRRLLEDRIVE